MVNVCVNISKTFPELLKTAPLQVRQDSCEPVLDVYAAILCYDRVNISHTLAHQASKLGLSANKSLSFYIYYSAGYVHYFH